MVCFNNLCLKYLSVSFYFLARSLTIIFNVIFTYFLLNVKTSPKALACCAVIIVGYCVGIIVEGNLGPLSLIGVVFGIASSITCALNSIYTAKCLPKVEGSVWRLTFYNNINSLLLLIPVIGLLEYQSITEHLFHTSIYFWFIMLISGIFGFAIGYISTLQIQVTSPLTHNVSGTAKAAAQTVLAVIIYHEIKSVSWWLSNVITLGGSIFYSAVRHSENVRKPKESVDFNQNDKSSILVVDDGDDTKHSLLNHLNNNGNKNSLFDTSDELPSSRIGLV
uniref:GDP-fucose transporter n=1 Tax=Schistosoma japonicum TaxID=6182 RepID=C1LHB8_SCHJA|nr:GDP-fucose transporter [Schistosoma japonicum]